MGLVQLATRVLADWGSLVEVEIIDGGSVGMPEALARLDAFAPELVGISVLTPTYSEGLKIAARAAQLGAEVVMGDDHAIFFPEEILRRRSVVDFVIANDVGETPFSLLVGARLGALSLDRVPSLWYRDDAGRICRNDDVRYSLKERNTVPDLSLISDDLPTYASRYRGIFGHLHQGDDINPVTVNFARGCENGRYRCSYCSIADLGINTGDPAAFWRTVRFYHEEYGINLFFEVYDSFTASPRYVVALLDSVPPDIARKLEDGEIELMVYARALGLLKQNSIDKLQRLGVRRVNIGLDAGDTTMLEAQRKNHTTADTNRLALQGLAQAGMTVHASYILGAPGETRDSVNRTIEEVHDLLDRVKFSSVEMSRLYPLPNCPIWDMLVDYQKPNFYRSREEIDAAFAKLGIEIEDRTRAEIADRFRGEDLLDFDVLMGCWYRHFTHVDEQFVIDEIDKLDRTLTERGVMTGNNVG